MNPGLLLWKIFSLPIHDSWSAVMEIFSLPIHDSWSAVIENSEQSSLNNKKMKWIYYTNSVK